MTAIPEIILASSSLQRQRILEELEIPFVVVNKEVEEITTDDPVETVVHNAVLKATTVAEMSNLDSFVLAADTVLTHKGKIFGKPKDESEARLFLSEFSGNIIQAWTGLAVVHPESFTRLATRESAEIVFKSFSLDLIDWYVATGEPLTRAGAFGISKSGEILVAALRGSYSCVAGLPKLALMALLGESFNLAGLMSVLPFPPVTSINGCAVDFFHFDSNGS